jgi:D-glycero-alpha-D-manno-heptose 1-phosphate guanylyltransferase
MVINEAIILAGGLGTRLRSVVPDLPKCMAPVNGKPFLTYIINHLRKEGIHHFIFSLGYKSEVVIDFLEKEFPSLFFKTCIEDEPLGTGGAIKKALSIAKEKSVLVTNGDTLFKIDVTLLAGFHSLSGAECSLSLKPMKNFDRYGVVEVNRDHLVESFKEKALYEYGLINGGVYAIHKHRFFEEPLPDKFSFEKDYLEKYHKTRRIMGIAQDEYFIDIGVPEDYARAQEEFRMH